MDAAELKSAVPTTLASIATPSSPSSPRLVRATSVDGIIEHRPSSVAASEVRLAPMKYPQSRRYILTGVQTETCAPSFGRGRSAPRLFASQDTWVQRTPKNQYSMVRTSVAAQEGIPHTSRVAERAWTLLNHYTNRMSLLSMQSIPPKVLERLDIKYIAVATVRARSEVELLEGLCREKRMERGVSVDWNKRTLVLSIDADGVDAKADQERVSVKTTLSETIVSGMLKEIEHATHTGQSNAPMQSLKRIVNNETRFEASRRSSLIEVPRLEVEMPIAIAEEPGVQQMFRKAASAYACTVAERGSVCRTKRSEMELNAIVDRQLSTMAKMEERISLFEAAWGWIDTHLDHYADIFYRSMSTDQKTKRELWGNLTRLRQRKENLRQELRTNGAF